MAPVDTAYSKEDNSDRSQMNGYPAEPATVVTTSKSELKSQQSSGNKEHHQPTCITPRQSVIDSVINGLDHTGDCPQPELDSDNTSKNLDGIENESWDQTLSQTFDVKVKDENIVLVECDWSSVRKQHVPHSATPTKQFVYVGSCRIWIVRKNWIVSF